MILFFLDSIILNNFYATQWKINPACVVYKQYLKGVGQWYCLVGRSTCCLPSLTSWVPCLGATGLKERVNSHQLSQKLSLFIHICSHGDFISCFLSRYHSITEKDIWPSPHNPWFLPLALRHRHLRQVLQDWASELYLLQDILDSVIIKISLSHELQLCRENLCLTRPCEDVLSGTWRSPARLPS